MIETAILDITTRYHRGLILLGRVRFTPENGAGNGAIKAAFSNALGALSIAFLIALPAHIWGGSPLCGCAAVPAS